MAEGWHPAVSLGSTEGSGTAITHMPRVPAGMGAAPWPLCAGSSGIRYALFGLTALLLGLCSPCHQHLAAIGLKFSAFCNLEKPWACEVGFGGL